MLRPKPPTADSELNMTPMIDIVFQLILFFLLSLKFKTLDYRIESALPKDRGPDPIPVTVVPTPRIKATLFRIDAEDLVRARTKVKVGAREWLLPPVDATPEVRDAAFASVRAELGRLHGLLGVPGEIDTPAPSGALVPHADVVGVLDAFLSLHIDDVAFQGVAPPMPRAR